MMRSRKTVWYRLVIGLLTLPLLELSCVEMAQRSVINGLFDATTPILDDCLAGRLTGVIDADGKP